mgnify:CR=1 FL=1
MKKHITKKVKVEYSTFGTNEDMYNQLTIGDTYDLICPSEYMTMKLMAENKILKYSDEFWDTSDANNYYAKGVSPYIKKSLDQLKISRAVCRGLYSWLYVGNTWLCI